MSCPLLGNGVEPEQTETPDRAGVEWARRYGLVVRSDHEPRSRTEWLSVSVSGAQADPGVDWFDIGFRQAVVGLAIADLDGKLVMANPALCDLLDRSVEVICGTELRDHAVSDEGQRRVAQGLTDPRRPNGPAELSLRRRDGEVIWTEVTAHLKDEDGPNAYWVLHVADITARKKLEVSLDMLTRRNRLNGLGDRPAMEAELHLAFIRDEITVVYQPVVSLENNQITGAEALVRWQHPQRGLLTPDEVLPAVASAGLMGDITGRVLRQACAQLAEWRRAEVVDHDMRIAVNLAASDLCDESLLASVEAVLELNGLDGRSLILEVTEQGLVTDVAKASEILQGLRAIGVHIALDDFGTGYSSLSHVNQFPVDSIKIDRSFVRGLDGDAESATLVRGVLSLARSLGPAVIAEGIETQDQLSLLRRMGCQFGQGFLWSPPVPAGDFRALLARGTPHPPTENTETTKMIPVDDPLTDINRLIEISNYDLFSPQVRAELDQWAQRAATRFDLPAGMVSIVLEGAQYWAGMYGVDGWKADANGTPVEWAFCATVVRTGEIYVVEDATTDDRQKDNPLVKDFGQRCYAGAPLTTSSGYVLGAYCVAGDEARKFTEGELAELSSMADEVLQVIERHRVVDDTPLFPAEAVARGLSSEPGART
jgi:PAS domain S-box-containing protein